MYLPDYTICIFMSLIKMQHLNLNIVFLAILEISEPSTEEVGGCSRQNGGHTLNSSLWKMMTMPSWGIKLHVLDGFCGGSQHASLSGLRVKDYLQFYFLCYKEPLPH